MWQNNREALTTSQLVKYKKVSKHDDIEIIKEQTKNKINLILWFHNLYAHTMPRCH